MNSSAPPAVPSISAIRNSHRTQKYGVRHQGQRRQGQLGANELGEHLVQILEHVLQKLALRARLHQRKQHFMETAPIAQKKNGEDRHQKKQPHLLRRFGRAYADVLRQAG